MRLLVVFLIIVLSMQASPVSANFYNGKSIYEKCTDEEVAPKNFCIGWIVGTFDALQWRKRLSNKWFYCLRGGVSIHQLEAIFIKYLKDHPDKWHVEAAVLFELAITRAFPCKEN